MISQAFRTIRTTLVAGVLTPILPPVVCSKCIIGNGTAADVLLYTNTDLTQAEYRAIAANYDREIAPARVRADFQPTTPAFWLLSSLGGLVVIEWS